MIKPRRDIPAASIQHPTVSPSVALKRLEKLLEQIPETRSSGHDSAVTKTWNKNVRIALADFYGEASLIFREFDRIRFRPGVYYDGQPPSEFVKAFNHGLDQAKDFLESRLNDLREGEDSDPRDARAQAVPEGRKVFVVHGHNHGFKETVARFLARLDLEPIILHEQADQGNTVIEKFEAHTENVSCAVVILTGDDLAASKDRLELKEIRARQNVILELGYFVGRLGRDRTFALVEEGVNLPSDIHGLIYIPMKGDDWRLRLVKELKAVGLDVDANRAF